MVGIFQNVHTTPPPFLNNWRQLFQPAINAKGPVYFIQINQQNIRNSQVSFQGIILTHTRTPKSSYIVFSAALQQAPHVHKKS